MQRIRYAAGHGRLGRGSRAARSARERLLVSADQFFLHRRASRRLASTGSSGTLELPRHPSTTSSVARRVLSGPIWRRGTMAPPNSSWGPWTAIKTPDDGCSQSSRLRPRCSPSPASEAVRSSPPSPKRTSAGSSSGPPASSEPGWCPVRPARRRGRSHRPRRARSSTPDRLRRRHALPGGWTRTRLSPGLPGLASKPSSMPPVSPDPALTRGLSDATPGRNLVSRREAWVAPPIWRNDDDRSPRPCDRRRAAAQAS